MAETNSTKCVHLDSTEPYDEYGRELGYLLEMVPDRGWDLWLLVDEEKAHAVLREQSPHNCFNRILELPVDLDIYELQQSGAICEVAYQDWDSGAPGAGAGRVSVYRLGDERLGIVYFISHDAGLSEAYDELKRACEDAWIDWVNDATREIWVSGNEESGGANGE